MARKALSPTETNFYIQSSLHVTKKVRASADQVAVNPYKLSVFDSPEFRVMKGWPVAPPRVDVRSNSLASSQGVVFADQPDPQQLVTRANARWLASAGWDDIAKLWYPFYSDIGSVRWESSDTWMPTQVQTYSYIIGDARYVQNAINIDATSSEHMWLSAAAFAGNSGYSIVIAGTVNSVYGNTEGRSSVGIIGNGVPTPFDGAFEDPIDNPWSLSLTSNEFTLNAGKGLAPIQAGDLIKSTTPFYIAVVLGKPKSSLYLATGPSAIRSSDITVSAELESFDTQLVLGRSFGDTLHTADMVVMDIGLYGTSLSPDDVKSEIAQLSRAYGGQK